MNAGHDEAYVRERHWHYFVGDIHGCFQTLLALEARIRWHAAGHGVSPKIVSAGDLIDRGPRSNDVVRHFGDGIAAGTHAAVMGNHDALFLTCFREFGPWAEASLEWPAHIRTIPDEVERGEGSAKYLPPHEFRLYRKCLWVGEGGYQTLTSYGCDPHATATWSIPRDALLTVLALPLLWQNDDFVVTHALASSNDLEAARALLDDGADLRALPAPERRRIHDTAWSLLWRRNLPAQPPDPKRIHVSGHTPCRRVRRFPARRLVQVDTGCVYEGRLSAWCGESDTVLSEPLQDPVS